LITTFDILKPINLIKGAVMSRGGYRPGAGRKKGSHITKTAAIVAKLADEGATPLDVLLATMRDNEQPLNIRLQCATAAAPYVHPRLAHIQHERPKTGALQRLYDAVQAELAKKEEQTITLESSSVLPVPLITDAVMVK